MRYVDLVILIPEITILGYSAELDFSNREQKNRISYLRDKMQNLIEFMFFKLLWRS
jgi:hypothetical protein